MHARRKAEHLDICLHKDVRSAMSNGLERYRLVHKALPEMALADVELGTSFLGHPLGAPLLVSSMTGGTSEAHALNLRLAEVAQHYGLAMGLGSQRAGIEDPALMETYQVRSVAPGIALYANLGAVQLVGGRGRVYGVAECRRAVEAVEADALILHLNPLQEALQPGGDTDFTGVLMSIEDLCHDLDVPVIVKEVGWGLSGAVARQLADAGVAALDVAGAGGTSWSEVERQRGEGDADAIAAPFAAWGIPTAEALVEARSTRSALPLIASGGIRNGVEVALCLGLGADLVGMAGALLGPADESVQALSDALAVILQQLRIAMFCSGARTVAALRNSAVPRAGAD
ncbi:MAG: type 2 isopentenyl-diphosphate Delta-isomerase [Chloroflexi bacterium]|nr:type 2 isopentenyl-diphosphate Delta-isomerase [Chloroflexota bacterium]